MADNDGFRPDWAQKDFYAVLGVAEGRSRGRHQEGLPQARARQPPRLQPGRRPPSTRSSRRSPRPTTSSATPRSARSTTRCARCYGSGGFGGRLPRRPAAGGGFNLDDLLGDRPRRRRWLRRHVRRPLRRPARHAPQQQPRRPQQGRRRRDHARRSAFTDAIDGVTISLRLTSDAACPTCSGTGGKPGTKPHICPECEGAGYVVAGVGGAFSMNETCPACGGRQLVYDEPCPTCHGTGRGTSGPHRSRPGSRPGSRTASGSGSRARAPPARTAARPATCSSPSR